MRIGFDAKRAFYNNSGLGNYSRHTISILSRFAANNDYLLFTPSIKQSVSFEHFQNNKIVTPKGISKLYTKIWRRYHIVKNIENEKIDVYHGLSNELPYKINKIKTPSVVSIHDLIFLRYPDFYRLHDREIYKTKFFNACRKADKIIAISNQTKLDIIEFFNINENKIKVVYQGCSPVFNNIISKEKLNQIKNKYKLPSEYILNVGTIEERKNILSVIKAIHVAKIKAPLVIVGKKTTYFNIVKEYVVKNNLTNKIFFFHDVPFVDLPAFYKLSSLFVYPSLFEGFGIPIIEALSSGVPVITTKHGCFTEAAGENSLTVNPKNIEEIEDAIKKSLYNNKLRKIMIEAGYKHIENFSEQKIAENLISVYNDVVG